MAETTYAGPFTATARHYPGEKRLGARGWGLGRAEEGRFKEPTSRWDGTRDPHSQLLLGLTIVLDDALEVVCHQRPESPFVRQTQPVGKDNCSIHHCAMDKLEGGSRKETCLFSLSHRDRHSLGLTMLKQSSGQPLKALCNAVTKLQPNQSCKRLWLNQR